MTLVLLGMTVICIRLMLFIQNMTELNHDWAELLYINILRSLVWGNDKYIFNHLLTFDNIFIIKFLQYN